MIKNINNYPVLNCRVRFISACPYTKAVNVYSDGRLLIGNCRFGETSNYLNMSPTIHRIEIFDINNNSVPILTYRFEAIPNRSYSLTLACNNKKLTLLQLLDYNPSSNIPTPWIGNNLPNYNNGFNNHNNNWNGNNNWHGNNNNNNAWNNSQGFSPKDSTWKNDEDIDGNFQIQPKFEKDSNRPSPAVYPLPTNPQMLLNFGNLRFINLSPNSPLLDLNLSNGKSLFKGVEYLEETSYYKLSPGVYNFTLSFSSGNVFKKKLPNISVLPNTAYTIYVIGLLNGKPDLGFLILKDA